MSFKVMYWLYLVIVNRIVSIMSFKGMVRVISCQFK
jgi:hypothetical protein